MSIADDIRSGALIPIAVFGGPDTCPHCKADIPWAYGLCDRFSKHAPGGSDCNRAEFFMLRPNDHWGEASLAEIRAAINEVLQDDWDRQP